MESVYRVKAIPLVAAIKETLKNMSEIELPKNHDLIKTSHGKQYSPEDPNWFYTRMASVVRAAMRKGSVSLKGLARKYSCRKNAGVRPSRYSKGSDFVIQSAIEQLVKIGWFSFSNKKDVLTKTAKEVLGEILEKVSNE
ncbi:Rps19ep [Glugoides intestinalis]